MSAVIDVVAGARPNFVKVAPLLKAMARGTGGLRARLVHTGQHYDPEMSEVFFRQLGIPRPDVELGVGSGTHGEQTARVLLGFERHLATAAPSSSGVVVVGDVNSTLACALGAVKLGVPVAHVEAGLRSFDRTMPEEINRVLTDSVAELLFVSEPSGEFNLRREGAPEERIRFVGNVMIDSLRQHLSAARATDIVRELGLEARGYALVTLHRPSNVDEEPRLTATIEMLERVARALRVVFPVHPRTRQSLQRFGLLGRAQDNPAFRLTEPLGYWESLGLLDSARLVLTDSGGIQEEATALNIPCLTLRTTTERPITVTDGSNTVIGHELSRVEEIMGEILAGRYKKARAIDGWDGKAAERIVGVLADVWGR